MTENQRLAAVTAWSAAKAQLELAKAAESAARTAMYATCFPDQVLCPVDGTHYAPLLNGWRLKAIFATTYKVDQDTLPALLLRLTDMGDAGQHAADTCFKYKPELVGSAYRNLMPTMREVVDTVLTSSPTSPQFTLVEPKAAKQVAA